MGSVPVICVLFKAGLKKRNGAHKFQEHIHVFTPLYGNIKSTATFTTKRVFFFRRELSAAVFRNPRLHDKENIIVLR